jgi:hypothetical protein
VSVRVTTWVWENSPASGTELLILLALADQSDDDGLCWPSIAYIARKTRLHEDTVNRNLRSLIDRGEVSREERPGRSNLLRIIRTPLQETGGSSSGGFSSGGSSAPPTPPQAAPPPPRSGPPQNHQEPPREPSSRTADPSMALVLVTADATTVSEPTFEDFWRAYPKKRSRADAQRAWAKAIKARKVGAAELVAAAERLRDDPNLPDLTYVPNGATWLNGERWNDDPYPPRRDQLAARTSTTDSKVQAALELAATFADDPRGAA